MVHFQSYKQEGAPPRTAVLLAAYNGLRWLPQQLDSILSQHGVSLTVFVSVDRSSDGTEGWLLRRAREDSRIVCLPFGQTFGAAATNFFRLFREVDLSGFDFVALADQDDVWMEGKLARAVEVLEQEQAEGYSSNVIAFWPTHKMRLLDKAQPQRKWDHLFEAAGPGCTYVLRAGTVRRFQELLRAKRGRLDEIGLHDWLLYAFVRAKGHRWIIDRRPGVLYRQHGENQVGANIGIVAFGRRAKKVLSGWAMDQAARIAYAVEADRDPVVAGWLRPGRTRYLRLAINAGKCRRRTFDRALFFCSCMLLAVRG